MSMANTPVLVISRPMPQQPMPPLRRAKQRTPDRRKRYGMVFNTDPLQGMLEEDDDDSTWSMSRSRSSRRMLSSRHTSVRTRNSSPAQEIAARYRASRGEDPNASSSSVSYLQVPSVGGYTSASRSRTTSGETSISSTSGPRVRYRDSRAHAMDRATKEAYVMAVRCGSYLDIPCQRPGCRDILPDIRNLASHLAIHDLEPRVRYAGTLRQSSFVDMGHLVDGRPRRRYMRSPAPYAESERSHSKLRRYLWKLTSCVPCHVPDDDDDDFF
ncbi:hypothetical protein OH76DRAFT_1335603 [Lentinus brumalis]|uniref:Uncharacterized protein n=1 Tax=Lentinus brumalis TaxID=2498619 RepID=A0A371DXJ1_9APHY|nr:hypothetical protein OH76DRAFT_1335603 [Polyporus brumalis]